MNKAVFEIKSNLKTKILGQNILHFSTVTSTNDVAKQYGNSGGANGTVVIADNQTNGKGRLGRQWHTQQNSGIIMSVLLCPDINICDLSTVTMLTGMAVCSVVNKICPDRTFIKWPNDIIIDKKKLCGILVEYSFCADKGNLIIGIGVNVDNSEFSDDIKHKATSIYLETKQHLNKNKIIADILNELEVILLENNFKFNDRLLCEYKKFCANICSEVQFVRDNKIISGIATDVDVSGGLVVRTENNQNYIISSGEVTVKNIY